MAAAGRKRKLDYVPEQTFATSSLSIRLAAALGTSVDL